MIIFNVGLIDDEAYHWSWTLNLSYSYYDHPGMVAWMIWPFIKIFENNEWAIRMPAFLTLITMSFLLYQLGKEIFDEKVGQLASLLVYFIPLWGFAGLGTMPDTPLALFWMLIFYFFWQSVRPDEKAWSVKKSWLLIGLAMGLGMNSKLTCCLIGLGIGFYLLVTPRVRHHLKNPWPYVAIIITFLMMAPIFVWNSKHQWATFEYQFFRRHHEALGTDWNRWLQFWSYQWIFMSPGVYFTMLLTFLAGLLKWKDEKWRLFFCVTFPTLALFYYQPLKSAYKPHWSGPAYMILLIGASALFLQGLRHFNIQWVRPKSKWLAVATVIFLIPFNLLYIPLFTPIIPKIYSSFNDPKNWEPKWDFSNEFYGWIDVGDKVKSLRDQIEKETGKRPFVGAQRYELIAQLTWGMKEKVWQMTNEMDQYHFDQPDSDKAKLIGQDALIVNNDKYPRDPREVTNFDSCTQQDYPIFRGEVLARTFYIYHCKNYQGIK
ncbi:MAG: glycoside hydrolase [Oligoflexia bacterium]|nr:MAG: glycoside hydrolase [Oligoflexia bacterium]